LSLGGAVAAILIASGCGDSSSAPVTSAGASGASGASGAKAG
jgi:hypothetical protein